MDDSTSVDIDKFLLYSKQEKSRGKTAKQIASSLGMSTTKYKDLLRRAKAFKRVEAS